jgi:hypothetical protein
LGSRRKRKLKLYFYCVEELCTRLQDKERYEDIHKISHRAAEIYPFDNWQVWEIDSLISMSRYKEGLEVYRNTEKRLMDELGIAPSPQLVERFRFMGERASQAAGAIEDIKYRLMEKENVSILLFLSKFCRCVSCIQQDGRTNGIVGIYHALHVELREQRSYGRRRTENVGSAV